MENYIGKRLDGRYVLEEILGVGGMAVVYKAYDTVNNRTVAIKILKEEYASNEGFLHRFQNESKAISLLSHPNIVKIYDVSFGDMIQYIVMEYIDGITLKEYIENSGCLSWEDAVYYTIQILRGLQHAHDKGIVHRDVKPQNIMLLKDGTIKVTDFGIARFARSESQTMTDKAIGSVHYISPEQARGEVTNEKADIYSVGVILYEMITGKLPFEADSAVSVAIMQLQNTPKKPRELNPTIPKGLEQITLKAMKKDRAARYQSASEMLRDLEEFRRDPDMVFDNEYYVDDSPTKFVDISGKGENSDSSETDDKKEKPIPIIPILSGIAAAFVLLIVCFSIWLVPSLCSKKGSFKCPKFVGLSYDSVVSQYPDYEFTKNEQYDSKVDKGYIISQSPEADRLIKSKKITLTVSLGPANVTVPMDIYVNSNEEDGFESLSHVKEILENAGFKITERTVENEGVSEGIVVGTEPKAGSSAAEGSEVVIYVSGEKKLTPVEVPYLIGLSKDEAIKTIKNRGLKVGTVKSVKSSLNKGMVISQSIAKGEEVAEGTKINLEISSGEEKVKDYSVNVSVSFNRQLPSKIINVIAYLDGEEAHTSKQLNVDGLSNGSYKFTVTSTEQSGKLKVCIKDSNGTVYDYADYTVDFKNGKATLSHEYPISTDSTESDS